MKPVNEKQQDHVEIRSIEEFERLYIPNWANAREMERLGPRERGERVARQIIHEIRQKFSPER